MNAKNLKKANRKGPLLPFVTIRRSIGQSRSFPLPLELFVSYTTSLLSLSRAILLISNYFPEFLFLLRGEIYENNFTLCLIKSKFPFGFSPFSVFNPIPTSLSRTACFLIWMMCFSIFKDKSKSRLAKSAPEFGDERRPDKRKTQSAGSSTSARSIPEMYREKEQNLRVFSFSELRKATNDFNRLLKIGEGGFGSVYKGTIKPPEGDPIFVAIKKLNRHGLQGHKQWLAEVQFLGVVNHPNLVKLLGYCSLDGERGIQRLLVYEFMPNKSLEDHLFNRAMPPLPWKTRLNILLGAANGMAYLHEGLEVQVIYRDFKTSNVLLDEDFNPKLSDFGLAREGPEGDRTHVSTAPVGTYGYAAPEYVETGHLSVKSDIWSFGVVLYEILTGRRTVERSRPTMEQKLLDWVKQFPADSKRFGMIIDPRIRNLYSLNGARRIARLANSCLSKNAKDRPTMSEVVESLKQAIQDSDEGTSNTLV